MKKIFSGLVLAMLSLGIGAAAQEIEAGMETADARLEGKFVKLEEAFAQLTSKVEEAQFENKQSGREAEAALKDAALRVGELRDEVEKLAKRAGVADIEIENIRNTLFVLRKNLADIESRATGAPAELATPTPAKKDGDDVESLLVAAVEAAKAAEIERRADDESYDIARRLLETKDFTGAAIAFADNIKARPEGANFHSNLAGLGLSMEGLGKTAEACRAFSTVLAAKDGVGLEVQKIAVDKSDELKCGG